MIGELKRRIAETIYHIVPPPPASYSQAGEDAIIRYLFGEIGKNQISYLDLGTNHPVSLNNTFLFYKKNSRGVCVEADGTLIQEIKKLRPKDKVIHAGVSFNEETESDFYIFNNPALNTFNKLEAEYREKFDGIKILRIEKVPLININQLIKSNFETYPDLISIDIEEWDLEVLKSLDYPQFPIPVICVETCVFSKTHIKQKNPEIEKFMQSKGYEIYADTYINTIFVNKEWFYKL
jgi:hypothetical protein